MTFKKKNHGALLPIANKHGAQGGYCSLSTQGESLLRIKGDSSPGFQGRKSI